MNVANAVIISGNCSTANLAYRTTCTFECNPGYERNGSDTITCQLDKQWSPDPPTCERKRLVLPGINTLNSFNTDLLQHALKTLLNQMSGAVEQVVQHR